MKLIKALLFFAGLTSIPAWGERPNFVFILADDLGYGDVGVHGCKDIPTPHIDSIARDGIRFSSGYSNHPVCSPMRAGFLTGRYQHRFGYETNVPYDPLNPHLGVPDDEVTVPQRLQKAGYATAAIGKWHLGAHPSKHPNHRGFDFFYGFLGGGHDYFTSDLSQPDEEGYKGAMMHNGTPEGLNGYLTNRLTDEAVKWINGHKEQPFYLYLAYNAPHTPMQAPEEKLKQFASIQDPRRRTYAAMVSEMDDGIGAVLKALDESGLRKNTVVAFLSDNGGPLEPNASTNGPLRAGKGSIYEGGVRVPFLLSWPGTLPMGKVDARPVIALDLPVTALHLAGASTEGSLDGVDLMPFLKDPAATKPVHEGLFWRTTFGRRRDFAVRSGDLKLTSQNKDEGFFNVVEDVSESKPLAEGDRERLRRLWDEWNKGNRPPLFMGYGPYHPKVDAFYQKLQDDMKNAGE